MRESCLYGSARGVLGNRHSYRNYSDNALDNSDRLLVVRFVSPYQVKLTAAGKALVNREAARIAWDEDSSKLVPDAAGAGCD